MPSSLPVGRALSRLRRSAARRWSGRLLPDRFTTVLLVVAALGTGLVLARELAWGIVWEGDSVRYLSAARSLVAGEGFVDANGRPLSLWPPLYPLLLTGAGVVDPIAFAAPLNLAAFGLTILCFGRYLRDRLDSVFLRVWAPLALALALPLADVARRALSETVFILFATLALMSLDEFLEDRRRAAFARTTLFAALAWQTRYLGFPLVLAVGLLLLLRGREAFAARVKRALVFGAATALPLGLWLWRNQRLFGEPVTNWGSNDLTPAETLGGMAELLRGWAAFDRGPLTVAAMVLVAVAALALRKPLGRFGDVERGNGRVRRNSNLVPVFGAFAVSYVAVFVFVLAYGGSWSGVLTRYVTPLYVPALALLLTAADRLFARARRSGGWRFAAPIAGFGMVFWLGGQIVPTARAIAQANSRDYGVGNGLNGARYRESETLRFLGQIPEAELRTNGNLGMVYLHHGRRVPEGPLPRREELLVEEDFSAWLRSVPDGTAIVWFRLWTRDGGRFLETPTVLRLAPNLVPVRDFADGTVFEVDRTAGPPAPSRWTAAFDSDAEARGEPEIREAFEVRYDGGALLYSRAPCAPSDAGGRFYLTLEPGAALRSAGSEAETGFFDFREYGAIREGRCLALVPVPEGYGRFWTGQWDGTPPKQLWGAPGRLDRDRYRAARRALASGETGPPLVRAEFDLYLDEGELRYYREPCAASEVEARFVLALHPSPERAGPDGGAIAHLDFDFDEHGVREDGWCLARVPLPTEGYAKFVAGQWSETTSWSAAGRLDHERYRSAVDSVVSGAWGPPLVSSDFDLRLAGAELRYFREPCETADTEARFFLHLHENGDGAGDGRPGIENRDFDFSEHGMVVDGKCLAMVPLPRDRRFQRIATGQFRPGEPPFWRADLFFPSHRAALDSIASGAWGPPAVRSGFDLYLEGQSLWYHRKSCSAPDLESRFFLHLYPEDPDDLPAVRNGVGFENRDFLFSDFGGPRDGACLARVPLPDYPIARLRTGQFLPDGQTPWTAEIHPAAPPPDE